MLTVQAPPTAFDMQVQRWTRASPDYPRELNDLAHPPRELYTIGRRSALSIPRVAIVGTRNSTAYCERITPTLTRSLVRGGASIVSAMARGINAAPQRSALEHAA